MLLYLLGNFCRSKNEQLLGQVFAKNQSGISYYYGNKFVGNQLLFHMKQSAQSCLADHVPTVGTWFGHEFIAKIVSDFSFFWLKRNFRRSYVPYKSCCCTRFVWYLLMKCSQKHFMSNNHRRQFHVGSIAPEISSRNLVEWNVAGHVGNISATIFGVTINVDDRSN